MMRLIQFFGTPLLLTFMVLSCSDSTTGPDLSEAPSAPTIENIEMDFSIFEQADTYQFSQSVDAIEIIQSKLESLPESSDNNAYEQAAWFASFAELWFQTMGTLPSTFFQEQQWGEPDVDGDTWIWEWQFAYEGESLKMRITAEEVNNERHWELRYSIEGGEQDVDNALLIASQVRLDGSGGAWQLHDIFVEGTEPVFQMEYELNDDITTLVDMTFDQEEEGRFLYQRNDELSSLEMWNAVDTGYSILEWNNETGTGSITSEGYRDNNRVCWDENYEETEC